MCLSIVLKSIAFCAATVVLIGGCGVSPTGKSFRFVPCVRAFVPAHGLVAKWTWMAKGLATIFPFPFESRGAFSFPLYKMFNVYKVYEVYKV